jgi:diguanylate cyclase (GGDEF)-like protein
VVALACGTGVSVVLLKRGQRLRASAPDLDLALRSRGNAGAAETEERRALTNANEGVRGAVERALRFVRVALRARTAMVFWTRSSDGFIQLREVETACATLRPGIFDPRDTLLARVPGDGAVSESSSGSLKYPWYAPEDAPGSAVVVPLTRDGVRLGFLVIDREPGRPSFTEVDLHALRAAAAQVELAIHTELLILEAAAAARTLSTLDQAAAQLNRALTVEDVSDVTRGILSEFAVFDRFVVTACDREEGHHRIVHASGADVEELRGHTFAAGEGLAARAATRREVLPYDGRVSEPEARRVFEDAGLPGSRSLLVFPLQMPRGVVGTAVIASSDSHGFAEVDRHKIGIVIQHAAAALSNAFAYQHMEQMATTDGLTGLLNHRAFKERSVEAISRAQRSRRPLSLIITDIDHFKAVNDTYGHATGDDVIRAVAEVLATSVRDVDVPARYGGEEFAILLEDTSTAEASRLAERIRQRVQAIRFQSGDSPFSVTLSLGIAELEAPDLSALFVAADDALYAAKNGGRNRVVCHGDVGRAA